MSIQLRNVWIMVAVAACCLAVTAQEPEPDGGAVFEGAIDVRLVTVNVSVVDSDGRPVLGLSPEDFTVLVDGEKRDVTNFFAATDLASVPAPTPPAPASAPPDGATPDTTTAASADVPAPDDTPPSHMVLVFDNVSLEKRNRKRVVKALDDFLQTGLPEGTMVMVATTGPGFEIVRQFTGDRLRVRTALQQVLDSDSTGDIVKSNKRMLARSIRSSQSVRGDFGVSVGGNFGGPGGSGSSSGGPTGDDSSGTADMSDYMAAVGGDGFGEVQATQFLAQVEALRQQEAGRVVTALAGLNLALRGVAGVAGRKDVVWIGQDLVLQPGINAYRDLYTKFEDWSDGANMERPEIWATEINLAGQFTTVAGIAQATGTTVHVLDASDRDRDAASADVRLSDTASQIASDPTGPGSTAGYDLSGTRDLVDGSQYLAIATGGSFFGGTRKFDGFLDGLDGLLRGWYSLGYVPAGELDASMHDIEVEVRGKKSWRVRHHQKVANLSNYHRLANRAFSQLLLGEGRNPLAFEASAAGSEPYEDTGKIVQTVRLVAPFDGVTLVPEGDDTMVADLAVAVVAAEPDGNMSDPKLFRLPIKVSADQARASRASAASFRLVLEPGTQALAIAVRDETTGVVGSTTLPLP